MSATEVIIVLDKSGSMGVLHKAVVDGINKFIDEVQKEPGEGYWTLVQFSDHDSANGAKEGFPHYIYERMPDREVPRMKMEDFRPGGGTALIDAFCDAMKRVEDRVKNLPNLMRPKILFFVVTDGQENASTTHTLGDLRQMTARCQSEYGWKFIYLGANQDVFAETQKYNMAQNMAYRGLAANAQNALPMEATYGGMMQCLASGAVGTRAWKADGNPTGASLLDSAAPDDPAKIQSSR